MGGKEKKEKIYGAMGSNLFSHPTSRCRRYAETVGQFDSDKEEGAFHVVNSAGLTTKLPSLESAREFAHTNTKTVNFSIPKMMSVPAIGMDNIPELIRE